MNDFDKKGPVDISGVTGIQDTTTTMQGNKPKMVFKDSSKYVKKKPVSKQVPSSTSIPGTPVNLGGIDLQIP